jgi:hypothetical protein
LSSVTHYPNQGYICNNIAARPKLKHVVNMPVVGMLEEEISSISMDIKPQILSALQKLVSQSVFAMHDWPFAHVGHEFPPQSIPVSFASEMPFKQNNDVGICVGALVGVVGDSVGSLVGSDVGDVG